MDSVSQATLDDEVVFLTQREFDDLYAYNTSIPTGPKIGFRWKRKRADPKLACGHCSACQMRPALICGQMWIDEWDMGEAVPFEGTLTKLEKRRLPNKDDWVSIKWRRISVVV